MNTHQIATLAGGCFWCLEAIYEMVEGVENVVSGYAGGSASKPSYEQVCSGTSGHAEVVQITFDPAVVTLNELLGIFFTIHNPTTLNRQGGDVGTQYRSGIFFHNPAQEEAAKKAIDLVAAEGIWDNPIVTEVVPLEKFFPAEDYHQSYFANNPNQGYCRAVVSPKVIKFRARYSHLLKK
ncbi:MAG: peptide-methionine (S)-S-oxide reductase MsrA [Chloroflexota bacterium]